ETWDETDHQAAAGVEGYSRIAEVPEILERRHKPHHDGSVITLARIQLNDLGHVHHIDMGLSVRKLATMSPAAGWIRLPFKPVRLNPVKVDERRVRVLSTEQAEEYEFIVDEASAYCGERGARGTMEVPVPPGATKVVGFRLAGTTRGKVTVHLFRTGWNVRESRGERSQLVNRSISGPAFYEDIQIQEGNLDESHALAVAVI